MNTKRKYLFLLEEKRPNVNLSNLKSASRLAWQLSQAGFLECYESPLTYQMCHFKYGSSQMRPKAVNSLPIPPHLPH